MRRYEKKLNLQKANLLAEQRYLKGKGFIVENDAELEEDWKSNVAAGLATVGSMGANSAQAQNHTPDANRNSIQQTAQARTNDAGAADPFNTKKANAKLQAKLSNTFRSGASKVNPSDSEVQGFIQQINAFAQRNPGAIIKIDVVGSESQVPNQQNLPQGAIANARAKSVQDAIQQGVNANLQFTVKTTRGADKWDGGNRDDQKYTKDQFVSVSVQALQTSCSITKMEKTKGSTNTLSSEVTGPINNSIEPGNIPDRMVLTNDAGTVLSDTGFFADGSHKYGSSVKLIPKYVLELTKLRQNNDPSVQNLPKGSVVKVNSYDELVKILFADGADIKQFMRYENDFGKPLQELAQIVKSGGEVVLYQIDPSNVKTINYDLTGKTGKINVYSPLKQTDFKVSSNQCR